MNLDNPKIIKDLYILKSNENSTKYRSIDLVVATLIEHHECIYDDILKFLSNNKIDGFKEIREQFETPTIIVKRRYEDA